MASLMEQRTAALSSARGIADAAKADGDRPLTDDEQARVKSLLDTVDSLDVSIERAERSQAIVDGLFAVEGDGFEPGHDDAGGFPLKGRMSLSKAAPAAFAAMRKAPVAVGSTVVPVEVIPGIVPADRAPLTLLDALDAVRRSSPVYRYLQESVRTPNAGVVAPGASKPVSIFTVKSVDDRLRVVATVSEPIDKFILSDAVALRQFLEAELVDAVRRAIESQVVTGDGTGENFRGFNSISGVQTVTAAVDLLTGLRSAITKLQTVSIAPQFFAVNPNDWEAAQVKRRSDGAFDFAPETPVEAGQTRAWGVSIVPTSAVPVKTAWAVGADSVQISTDGQMAVEWGTPGDAFTKNQLVARAETRANLDALRPSGLVKITLAP